MRHEHVAVVPLLLAQGSIQEVTIPAAIAQLRPEEQARIGWVPDAILPDEAVHHAIANHTLRKESGA
jgi:sirohydrochlorin ferrochelatase